MSTIAAVFLSEYMDKPYQDVCDLLETWEGGNHPSDDLALPDVVFGRLVHVSRSLASLPMRARPSVADEPCIELRVLPVSTGLDALTELLLIAPDDAVPSESSSVRSRCLRSLLQAIMGDLDEALSKRSGSSGHGAATPSARQSRLG